ncbi:MAG TPA: selenocysteine-specific translation elongation factor [Ramlibacter sp.]|nr:selenocysteine-specific translation elongation factor [Ramlibacter sp.]
MIIATAGHIDHGKTTLVRALTGVDTDRLPEEKARGISIDLGFAHCTLGGATVGFVDVPGHERFVRNMLSGVYAVGHVLLVVAADDGVMPQTREHLHIVDMLGVGDGTVVITKTDRADAGQLARVEAELAALLQGTALKTAPRIAVSAVTGDGMAQLRDRLAAVASQGAAARGGAELARFVVDRAFTVAGSGTIVTGTVIAGAMAVGDTVVVTPAGTPVRVRRMQRHGVTVERANAGERCAINLAGLEPSQVGRGDWLVAAEAHSPTDRIDVRVKVLASEAAPLKHWTPVHVHIGAADVPARLALRRGEAVEPGGEAFGQLRLERAIHAAHGDRFILRDQSATRTLGGGAVVDPCPPARRHAGRPDVFAALHDNGPVASLPALIDLHPAGLELEWLARVFAWPLNKLLELLPADAVVVKTSVHTVFAAARVTQLENAVVERITRFHADQSDATGIELAQLRAELARAVSPDVFTALIRRGATRLDLSLQGSQARLARHDSTDNPRDLVTWQRLRPLLLDAGAAIPSVRELSGLSRVPLQPLRDLLHRKSAVGELVKVTPERFALPETLEVLGLLAAQTAASRPDGLFTAGQFRDTIGSGRGLAIEILECLDRRGVTQRRADLRAMRQPGLP